jgi:hypothetical protein
LRLRGGVVSRQSEYLPIVEFIPSLS